MIGYLSLLEFFLWGSRKGTKPQRGLDLCAFPSLRDILLFFFHAKTQRGLDLRDFPSLREERRKSRETRSKNQEKKEPLDFFAPLLLCEQKQKLKARNKPIPLALVSKRLVPCSLKKEPNFRSAQKSKVTCVEIFFLPILQRKK